METKYGEKFVKLISKEGEEFEVPVSILKNSTTLSKYLEADSQESKLVYFKKIISSEADHQ